MKTPTVLFGPLTLKKRVKSVVMVGVSTSTGRVVVFSHFVLEGLEIAMPGEDPRGKEVHLTQRVLDLNS